MKSSSTQLLGYLMFIVAVIVGLLLLIWIYLIAIKPVETEKKYVSQVGEYLLNHSIALAIRPTNPDEPAVPFDALAVTTALQQQPNCLQRLQADMQPSLLVTWNIVGQRCDKDCQTQYLANRLQMISDAVQTTSAQQQRQGALLQRYTFDLGRWAEQTCQVLGQQVSVKSAGHTNNVTVVSEHVLSSMKQFAQAAPHLLERGNVYWCERYRNVLSATSTQAQYCQVSSRHVEFSPRALAVSNPWSGLQGCLYLQGEKHPYFMASTRGNPRQNEAYQAWCAESVLNDVTAKPLLTNPQTVTTTDLDDPAWRIPQDLDWIMQGMMPLRKARELWSSEESAEKINLLEDHTIDLLGYEQPVGLHIDSTIHAERQAKLQQLAQCFVGNQNICQQLGLAQRYPKFQQDFDGFAEGSPVRTVGIVQLDIASGEIEVLASGQSKCFTHDHQFGKQADGCPKVNYQLRANPELLRNHAFFNEAQPASTNKPIIALSLMPAPPANLAYQLARSNSEAFAQHVFCNGQTPCPYPQTIQQLATSMGWNQSCDGVETATQVSLGTPRQQAFACGQMDLIFGKLNPISLGADNQSLLNIRPSPYGRLGVQPKPAQQWQPAGFQLIQSFDFRLDPPQKGKSYYHRIRSSQPLASEIALGQANARVTPVGVAGLYAHLVRAAQGQQEQILPHLVRGVYDREGNTPKPLEALRSDRLPITVNPAHATQVLNMMSGSSRRFSAGAGTAYASCIKVLSASQCNALTGIVAGKTGTPTVLNTRPYKWYVAAYRSQPRQKGFDKVIVVLVEPNWQANQLNAPQSIKSADNYAADIGFWSMALLGAFDQSSQTTQEK